MFTMDDCVYSVDDVDSIADRIKSNMISIKKDKVKYYNVPCSFDIESSSFYDGDDKIGLMYVWQFGIDGYVFIGRKWDEFIQLLDRIRDIFNINVENRLVIYVHNLAFEFQYIRKLFRWIEVFSIDNRKPIYATTCNGFEFRCSYLLSGYSLAKVGENLTKYKVEKMIGDLDYTLIRHYNTPLTDEELKYCFNDVMVVMCYIQERIEIDGDITKIPLTKTGYVRNFCRQLCLNSCKSHKKGGEQFKSYHDMMKELSIEVDEYKQLKRAFMGGFTHSNALSTGITLENVKSYDFTSSYPYCMISEKYPMGKGVIIDNVVDEKSAEKYLSSCCCVFDVEFTDLTSKISYENYISSSKCTRCVNPIINNGRVVCCDDLCITITNVDFDVIKNCYSWSNMKISNFRIYKKDYLPSPFIKAIIKLYQDKTRLKGVKGKEVEYMQSKEMLNSCYGMCVTDIARDDIVYDGEWSVVEPDDDKLKEELDKYNKSKKRFLFYPWGIFVTAYARKNLFTGILEFKEDYLYSDTDSIKVVNYDKHLDYINNYNKISQVKLQQACKYHNIDITELQPKTIKGDIKLLGVWDDDGDYKRFKTLGAKRYLYQDKDGYHITIAGTGKYSGGEYMKTLDDPFESFSNGLIIPSNYTDKLTHSYIDEKKKGIIVDYRGESVEYEVETGIHLEPCEYNLSLSSNYIDYLIGVVEKWK